MLDQPLLTLVVVIPVLNEEDGLPAVLTSLQRQSVCLDHIIVVDGGSCDHTTEVDREFGVTLFAAPTRVRGNQTATGVQVATEDVIIVGHADMVLPSCALAGIHRHLQSHLQCPGG